LIHIPLPPSFCIQFINTDTRFPKLAFLFKRIFVLFKSKPDCAKRNQGNSYIPKIDLETY